MAWEPVESSGLVVPKGGRTDAGDGVEATGKGTVDDAAIDVLGPLLRGCKVGTGVVGEAGSLGMSSLPTSTRANTQRLTNVQGDDRG